MLSIEWGDEMDCCQISMDVENIVLCDGFE